ncbi:glycerol-3-phosphate phosphatase isoform X3 [Embiotoca jacksoni]|uniref:glycerol-3-phosphate phosphatase isoform X3 n=1 Tax=Embiotoca jacksoni TaxID=100190 RepID=UPI00370376CA
MSGSKCTRLSGALVERLLDSVDSVLFDCDGVIWRGDQAIAGAPRVINLLKENGKKVFFVTNNSTKTRKMYADKMTSLGFNVTEEEVFGTAFCSAMYLKTECKLEGKVYLIGSNAMTQELEAVGIQQTGAGPDLIAGKQADWAGVPLDPEVKAVVVGFDEHFSYMKLNRALQYLTQRDCLFVGTNRDTRLPLEGGKAVPGQEIQWKSCCCARVYGLGGVIDRHVLQSGYGCRRAGRTIVGFPVRSSEISHSPPHLPQVRPTVTLTICPLVDWWVYYMLWCNTGLQYFQS